MGRIDTLDFSSLEKAIASLDEAVTEHKKNSHNKFVRDASIQRFEYTYELSHKMLKRYLEMTEASAEEIDLMAFPTLIRTGSEKGLLLNGWDIWKIFRDARNLTSHTYNEKKASDVCNIIPTFLQDAKYLLAQLKQRIVNQ
jgi:nucleotidyltransferase substrate binding protein (TIGR01987 family)